MSNLFVPTLAPTNHSVEKLSTRKPFAQSERPIIQIPTSARAIRRDRANGLTQKNASAGGDGKRFVVRADEKLTAFVELERAIRQFAVDLIS
jgi:hypothetical protein